MEFLSKNQKIDVEALKSRLLAKKTTRPRFRWEMTQEQATAILLASYQAEVEYRHRAFIADERTKENCRRLAAYLTADNPKFGIMLCGICGNGKTTMLYAFQSAMNWLSDCRCFGDERKGIRVIDAKEIAAYAKEPKSFHEIRSTDMLGIEDMGREATEVIDFGNVLNPVIDLLEYRYNQQLFTFITTNLKADEVRKKYGDRIADRFNEMLEVIIFGNTTYRK